MIIILLVWICDYCNTWYDMITGTVCNFKVEREECFRETGEPTTVITQQALGHQLNFPFQLHQHVRHSPAFSVRSVGTAVGTRARTREPLRTTRDLVNTTWSPADTSTCWYCRPILAVKTGLHVCRYAKQWSHYLFPVICLWKSRHDSQDNFRSKGFCPRKTPCL